LTAEIEQAFTEVDILQIADGKGIFDVSVNGQIIFSKYQSHRFPESGEVINLIKAGNH
jgi:selT/selW/selH-like putative selenoprotein